MSPRDVLRVARMRRAGILMPVRVLNASRAAGVPLPIACAVVMQETGGGRNEYGHDPTIFVGAGTVTEANYHAYKQRRLASGNRQMQGVGPLQLTWWSTQDRADRAGGCWRPAINLLIGYRALAALVREHGLTAGIARYNGYGPAADAYARSVLALASRFPS